LPTTELVTKIVQQTSDTESGVLESILNLAGTQPDVY